MWARVDLLLLPGLEPSRWGFLQRRGDLDVKKSFLTSKMACLVAAGVAVCHWNPYSPTCTRCKVSAPGEFLLWRVGAGGSPALTLGCEGTWFLEVKVSMSVLTTIPGTSIGRDPSQVKRSPWDPCLVGEKEKV